LRTSFNLAGQWRARRASQISESSTDSRVLADFIAAYNFARRPKTLNGPTPYEYICKVWTSEPDRFIVNPIHQMPGLNA